MNPLSRSQILVLVFVLLPEALLVAADHKLIGTPLWRPMAWQYAGFWAGLLHGWRPNYPAQPVTMFATYAFVHSGPVHAVGNALALAALGPRVEERGGTPLFWIILAISTLAGGLAFGILSRSPAPMVGASGAIFGLAAALVIWRAREMARFRWLRLTAGLAGLALINLAGWWLMAGRLAWETHLGGALGAIALAIWLPRRTIGPDGSLSSVRG